MLRKSFTVIALTCSFGLALCFAPAPALADTAAELQAKLDAANATLDTLYTQAEEASEAVNQTQAELDETEAEITQKQSELETAQEILADRVSSNYKTGGVSLLSILFESANFDEMVSRLYYASKVSASDAEIIQQVKDIQAELDAKKQEQTTLLAEQKTQQEELDAKVGEAETYVSSLDQQVQEAIAAERAAAEAEAAAARQAAEEAAANNGGSYVDATDTTTDNTDNSNTDTTDNTNNSSNNNSSSDNSGSSSSGLTQSQRDAIVSAAWAKVGCSYVYGATGPNAYDCSGFTQYCYAAAGISLPRTSGAQGSWGHSTSNPQAGDLVCWGGHVGIYMGGGMMIDAGNPSVGVSYRVAYSGHWFRTL